MKTILVTGGNRGIGLEICRQLDQMGHRIILCSRSLVNGKIASEKLSKNVWVRQLDITDEESVSRLFSFVKSEFNSLDVLINNAAIGEFDSRSIMRSVKNAIRTNLRVPYMLLKKAKSYLKSGGIVLDRSALTVGMDEVQKVMDTNLYGAWRMIQFFLPLLASSEDGRIINMSSGMGELGSLTGSYPGYRVSKASLNALTIMFASELATMNIKVNAVCPGWVKTDMGGPDAPLSVKEGADTVVWLATTVEEHSGKFFRERKIIDW